MGHDADGRELTEAEVREKLAETRPIEGRSVTVEGARSTATLRRRVAAQPTGQIAGALATAGAPISANQTVPPPAVPVTPIVEQAADGGGVTLRAGEAADGDSDLEPAYTREQLEQMPRAQTDEIAAKRGVTPEPGTGSGPDGAVADVDVINEILVGQQPTAPTEPTGAGDAREGDDQK